MCEEFFENSGQKHVEKLFVDESFITKKCFQSTKECSDIQDFPRADVLTTIKYPKANLYYAFSEDTYPTKRIVTVSKFFEEQKLLSHSESCKERFTNQDFNSEDGAINQYLKTEPPNFVIFGKPGLHHTLASAIADFWNCILISPTSLIQEEIDAGTEKGQYLERILQLGKSIKPDIVMNLIRCRIRKRDIKHRGYVIDCLPLIPNKINFDNLSYSSPVNMDDTCSEFCENTTCENYETHDDQIVSNNVGCKTQYEYEREIPQQIDEMFTLWPKPLIIIYLICPKQDVASRCARWRIDSFTGNVFEENKSRYLFNFGEYESDTSYDFSQVADEESVTNDDRRLKLLFDVKVQCELYEQLALPVIDKWILAHDPQHVIRVDGRSSTRQILEILKTRLCTLTLQPSILPKKMIEQDDIHFLEASTETNLTDELVEKSIEEIFEILRQREVESPEFLWKLSAWKFYCPVALAQGRTIKGLSKYAVRFLSKIFFLSSQEAVNLFIENPRTFLLPPNPRPTCKIAVFGPKYAGKSELSARLAEVFGGIVINVDEIMKKLIKQREESLNKEYENDSNTHTSLEPIDISVDEKANIIIQSIKEMSDMKLEDELRRDGGYVVDGMCVDVEVWRKIVDDANIVFEDIIVLFENEPYVYLLNKFRNYYYLDNSVDKIDMEMDQEEYKMLQEDAEWKYLEHLTQFESEWTKFEEQIVEFRGNVIKCNLTDIPDVTEYVINHIKSRFGTFISTEREDKENEIQEEEAADTEIETNLVTENAEKKENKYLPYTIDLETAERLLECGYFFFSAFGRWCPVQVYTNENPIHMFLPMKTREQIFPVVRHPYIYFLAGEVALSAFLNDPSKYLMLDCRPSLIPLRISIIGPPNSGKTTLANRFAETYGMKVITRIKALRHMLKYYRWTELARKTEDDLQAGRAASIESETRSLEMLSLGLRATTQGYILDNCPLNREEAEQLALLGMQPMIVLELKADLEFCIECLSLDNSYLDYDDMEERIRRWPKYSCVNYLSGCYAHWQANQASFRDWLKQFSQNVVEVDATRSKWYVWTQADHAVRSRFADIMLYFNESDLEKVHSLKNMCVSPYEFRSRQSRYESYCPICLSLEKILKTSGRSVDSQGMVQFREYFYWICPQHIDAFIKEPLQYISPVDVTSLLDERPRILEEIVDMEHACWAQRLQFNSFCLVTFVEGLPDHMLSKGKVDLGVILKDKVYLFCSEECREKFLQRHNKYSEIDIEFPREIPPIDVRHLPDVDFLQHTVAKVLVEAVKLIAARRPKIFGLSPAVSAAIYTGVYLKTHNTETENLQEVDIYEAVSKRMAGLHRIIEIATDTMKKKINPYVSLPKYPTRRVPVPDARFDYLCEYFKPASKVPAFLHVMDIAGLVKGAAEGQGLGNNFLSHIGACDGIFHLCRAFEDDDVTHIEGDVNPVRDLDIISEELRLKDVEFLNAHLEKLEKLVIRGNDKKLKPEYETLLKVKGVLTEEKKHIRFADWSSNDVEVLNKYLFLTSKPILYLVNLSEKDYIRKKNKWLIKIKEWVDKNDPGAVLIPFSGVFENKIFDMDETERAKYFEEHKVTSALDKIIVQGYKALNLQYFFTAGHDEVKAWTIQKGTRAPQAAGKIHTDFEKGFIMAEVMKFEDFKNEGSEAAVKAAGKYRQQGRSYVVEDGDIIFFKFNAGAGLKDPKKK